VLRARRNPGLRALADVAGLAAEPSSYHLGFVLGPRINAGGRVGDSGLGARLLTVTCDLEARRIAEELERHNRARKALEAEMVEEALAAAEQGLDAEPGAALLMVQSEAWHKGLIGLVASRLTERFRRPALAIAWERDGLGTGSARSIAGADIGSAVRAAVEAGLLVKGGGHAMAAGLTVERARVDELRDALETALRPGVQAANALPTLGIDGALSGTAATVELMALLDRAGPYGAGNPRPRFAFAEHRCTFVKPVGQGHLRCRLTGPDGARLDAIAFRAAESDLGALLTAPGRERLHLAGHLSRNAWGGREKIELVIEDAADPAAQGP
jgi:single-stranded-DNA-specific exonuclease